MRAIPALCAVAALISPMAARADLNMRPGLWESTTTVGGNTMPVEQKCYLQKDIDTLDRFQRGGVPPSQSPCSSSGYQELGNTMKYTLTCQINGIERRKVEREQRWRKPQRCQHACMNATGQ